MYDVGEDPTLKTFYFYGEAAQIVGDSIKLAVNTVPEAMNALAIMFPGFRDCIIGKRNADSPEEENFYRVVRVPKGCKDFDSDKAFEFDKGNIDTFYIGEADIHLLPVIRGSKNQSSWKIIAGVFTFGIGAIMGFGAGFTLTGAAATTGVTLGRIGLGMVLSGISMVLAPTPSAQSSESTDKKESFLFSGALNRTEQGNPVPIVYGEFLVGSVTVSAGLDVEDVIADVNDPVAPITTNLVPKNLGLSLAGNILTATWDPAFGRDEYGTAYLYSLYEYQVIVQSNTFAQGTLKVYQKIEEGFQATTSTQINIAAVAPNTSIEFKIRTLFRDDVIPPKYSTFVTSSIQKP